MTTSVRATAARVVAAILQGQSLNSALPDGLAAVAPTDRSLLQQLCYGTLRDAPRLQILLAQLLDKPLKARDLDIQGLLLVGLYQLEGSRVPDHAAVATSVEATRELHKPWARGLTNAVLRRFLRERHNLVTALDEQQASAHSEWLFKRLKRQWPHAYAGIIAANNHQPPMTLRVNAQRVSRAVYLERLADAGINARAGSLAPQAVYLETGTDVQTLPGFAGGDVSVQDEAPQLAALLLQAQPGERILDACAAPGGKTCHILELQPALQTLVAMDIDAARLARVGENLKRLGLNAECVAGDGARPPASLGETFFDRILVDAPCSASGVIRRHPDIKLLRREADLSALERRQGSILQGLWPLLRPGGVLLYVTCSVLYEENSQVVDAFLAGNPDASSEPFAVSWGEPLAHGRQLLPAIAGADGMFYAALRKAA